MLTEYRSFTEHHTANPAQHKERNLVRHYTPHRKVLPTASNPSG